MQLVQAIGEMKSLQSIQSKKIQKLEEELVGTFDIFAHSSLYNLSSIYVQFISILNVVCCVFDLLAILVFFPLKSVTDHSVFVTVKASLSIMSSESAVLISHLLDH